MLNDLVLRLLQFVYRVLCVICVVLVTFHFNINIKHYRNLRNCYSLVHSSASTTAAGCWYENIKNNLRFRDVQNSFSFSYIYNIHMSMRCVFVYVFQMDFSSIDFEMFELKSRYTIFHLHRSLFSSSWLFHWNACDVVGHAIFASIRLYASIHSLPRAARRASWGQSESRSSVSEMMRKTTNWFHIDIFMRKNGNDSHMWIYNVTDLQKYQPSPSTSLNRA